MKKALRNEPLGVQLAALCETDQGKAYVSDGIEGLPDEQVFAIARRTLAFQSQLNVKIRKWLKQNGQPLSAMVLLLALPLLAYGQEPRVKPILTPQLQLKKSVQSFKPHWYTPLDFALDATWAGVAIGDRLSTNYALSHCPTCYETSPVRSANARTAISFALIGATDWAQHRYPEKRKIVRWFKLGPIAVEAFAVVHNRGLVKR